VDARMSTCDSELFSCSVLTDEWVANAQITMLEGEIEKSKQQTDMAKSDIEKLKAGLQRQIESLKRAEEFDQALDALEKDLDRQIDDLSETISHSHHRVAQFNQVRGTWSENSAFLHPDTHFSLVQTNT